MMATVGLHHGDDGWRMERRAPAGPYSSADPDSQRIWWNDTGVHQNLTFSVHPDPISGMHCWHQAVRVGPAAPGDRHGDIAVDTGRAHEVYQRWLRQTRPAGQVSPDGTRRPRWLMRPLKPAAEAFVIPAGTGDREHARDGCRSTPGGGTMGAVPRPGRRGRRPGRRQDRVRRPRLGGAG